MHMHVEAKCGCWLSSSATFIYLFLFSEYVCCACMNVCAPHARLGSVVGFGPEVLDLLRMEL